MIPAIPLEPASGKKPWALTLLCRAMTKKYVLFHIYNQGIVILKFLVTNAALFTRFMITQRSRSDNYISEAKYQRNGSKT